MPPRLAPDPGRRAGRRATTTAWSTAARALADELRGRRRPGPARRPRRRRRSAAGPPTGSSRACPVRLEVGPRDLAEGVVTARPPRSPASKAPVPLGRRRPPVADAARRASRPTLLAEAHRAPRRRARSTSPRSTRPPRRRQTGFARLPWAPVGDEGEAAAGRSRRSPCAACSAPDGGAARRPTTSPTSSPSSPAPTDPRPTRAVARAGAAGRRRPSSSLLTRSQSVRVLRRKAWARAHAFRFVEPSGQFRPSGRAPTPRPLTDEEVTDHERHRRACRDARRAPRRRPRRRPRTTSSTPAACCGSPSTARRRRPRRASPRSPARSPARSTSTTRSPARYTLEVSSPGLERHAAHARRTSPRAVGQQVTVKTVPGPRRRPSRHRHPRRGRRRPTVVLARRAGRRRPRLAYDDIERARTVFEWGPAPKPGRAPSRARHQASRQGPRSQAPKSPDADEEGRRTMSNPDMMEALQALAADKGISVDTLFARSPTRSSRPTSACPSAYEYAWVTIDPDTGEIRVIAQELDEDGEPVGDELDVTPDDFGRIAAQTAKQVMTPAHPRGRARAEVRGVRRPRGRHRHRHHPAERHAATRCSTSAGSRRCCPRPSRCPTSGPSPAPGSRPTSSRSARPPRAPRSSSAAPTPASSSGCSSSRCPRSPTASSRSRPAPASPGTAPRSPSGRTTSNVDPVGACVGARGARVRMVVNELRGEKIDIVPFSDDPADFVMKALSPAKVKEVRIDEDTGTAEVIVPDYQLSLAIGKEGQNARLAARLTGWRVDIKSETQLAEEEAYAQPGLGRGRVGRRPEHRRAGVAAGRGRRRHLAPSSGPRPADERGRRGRAEAASPRPPSTAESPRRPSTSVEEAAEPPRPTSRRPSDVASRRGGRSRTAVDARPIAEARCVDAGRSPPRPASSVAADSRRIRPADGTAERSDSARRSSVPRPRRARESLTTIRRSRRRP